MHDKKYCYPNSNVLINKKDIRNAKELLDAEILYTGIRLMELQECPISGKFDFKHLCKIHKYIFQDIYGWAGKIRTIDIGKGNMFCYVQNINGYAEIIFKKYYPSCYSVKDNKDKFVEVLADNYADLNALHPFREGNGRSQREFARELCLACGYVFDLSKTTHKQMLEASILAFNKADNSKLFEIFKEAVVPIDEYEMSNSSYINILTSDDLDIEDIANSYEYYE